MDDIFQMLSSSARLDKSKRKKKRARDEKNEPSPPENNDLSGDDDDDEPLRSRDRTGKRDTSDKKQEHVHREQVSAFRKSLNIKLANKHDNLISDPISSFEELQAPLWWNNSFNAIDSSKDNSIFDSHLFVAIQKALQRNIEDGKWKEPTPIQMQAIPTLLERRDMIAAAPTGSGKSGAFLLPALFMASAPYRMFYANISSAMKEDSSRMKKKSKSRKHRDPLNSATRGEGEIRILVIAPSLELAAQLHREAERLGNGKPLGIHTLLLSKANAAQVVSGTAGGKRGLDVMISTPLRLVDSIAKGLKLDSVRMVILDEADRLLDASDEKKTASTTKSSDKDKVDTTNTAVQASGSTQSHSFLTQMDIILSEIPSTAIRALFSATVTPNLRSLAESILRNPVDVTVAATAQGGANPDIEQELTFVGREEGKLLAVRQLVARGQLRPPVIIFLQSQERAKALFGELLYDGIRVDVIHAGRSKAARENSVAKFRKGETWVLICTDLVARGVDFRAVNMVINYDLPPSGVTYVHRIGRTGRAGRKGKAITFFTEADFDNLRTIANVMKQSGCEVQDWMLNLKKTTNRSLIPRKRQTIDTTPSYDKKRRHRKQQMVQQSKTKKLQEDEG
jgi:ATP-dependent RNA helicase DDX52/ROK1